MAKINQAFNLNDLSDNQKRYVEEIQKIILSELGCVPGMIGIKLVDVFLNNWGNTFVNFKLVTGNTETSYFANLNHLYREEKSGYDIAFVSLEKACTYIPICGLVGIVRNEEAFEAEYRESLLYSNSAAKNIYNHRLHFFRSLPRKESFTAFGYSQKFNQEVTLVRIEYEGFMVLAFYVNREGTIVSSIYDSTIDGYFDNPEDILGVEGDFMKKVFAYYKKDEEELLAKMGAASNGINGIENRPYALTPKNK